MKVPFVVPLQELDATQVELAGGKGASLGELMQAGANVPPGFVVTSVAFEQFMNADGHRAFIDDILQKLEADEVSANTAAKEIAAHLTDVPMPADIVTAIEEGTKQLGVERVSVRSSATCEDSGASAWAGQLETYLNVTPEHIATKVRDCWLSMFRASAMSYGAAHGFGPRQTSVAVVVQQMVPSEVSGVGFSVHPVTQEPNIQLLEACFGLGEAIVSGRIVPDQYVIERESGDVLETMIGAQREGLFMDTGAGTSHWQTLAERGKERKLTEQQVVEYGRMMAKIHDHYGHPVDTEWAFAGGKFHVLQSRPITTLAEEYEESLIANPEMWMKIVRRPMTLLDTSIWAHWLDHQQIDREIGPPVDRAMSIQDEGGMANHFVVNQDQQGAIDRLADMWQNDRPQLIALLEKAHDVYNTSLERVQNHSGEFRDLDEAAEFLADVAQHTTVFPSWVLLACEQHGFEDQEVRGLAEGLRSHSLYPTIEHHIIKPLAMKATEALGFSAPEMAPQVITWKEMHSGSLDRETLEARLADIQAGKRFFFQFLDGQDTVRFLSQTGYLLMRLAKQRKIVPSTNPDVLSGQPAWPGVCRARARVIMSADGSEETIEDGEVLVSIQSNPSLMPLLRHCGAVVTDDGGIVCHAAIIARELRKPTLIGTGRATSIIRTGDLVEVDTYAQQVRILERAPVLA